VKNLDEKESFLTLKVNEEYEKLLPKLPTEEYEALKKSIKEDGQHYLITVNPNGIILDGHHRFKICNELGIQPKYEVKFFKNPLLEKKFVIESNLKRRHLNKFQRAKLILPLLEIEKALAKERQGERTDVTSAKYFADVAPKRKRKPLTPEQKEARRAKAKLKKEEQKKAGIIPKEPTRATAIVAKKGALSDRTLEKAKEILEKGSEELKQKVENNEMSISYAHMIIKRNERKVNQPPLPSGEFNVIYADPPWEYYLPLRGAPETHYPTMTTEKICELKVPASKDAILFLWATNPKLEDALKVIKAWGFEYKTNMVWVKAVTSKDDQIIKNQIGTGYYFRGQHELLLVAKKGNISPPDEPDRCTSVLIVPREEHSRKPDVVYEIIENMYPNGKYLELFATSERKGWVAWGNKLDS